MSRHLLILSLSLFVMLILSENTEAAKLGKICLTCCGAPPCCNYCGLPVTLPVTIRPTIRPPKLCLMCCGAPPCCNYCGLEKWFK